MSQVTTPGISDNRYFTFDPHRLPFSGAGEGVHDPVACDFTAVDFGEASDAAAIHIVAESQFSALGD